MTTPSKSENSAELSEKLDQINQTASTNGIDVTVPTGAGVMPPDVSNQSPPTGYDVEIPIDPASVPVPKPATGTVTSAPVTKTKKAKTGPSCFQKARDWMSLFIHHRFVSMILVICLGIIDGITFKVYDNTGKTTVYSAFLFAVILIICVCTICYWVFAVRTFEYTDLFAKYALRFETVATALMFVVTIANMNELLHSGVPVITLNDITQLIARNGTYADAVDLFDVAPRLSTTYMITKQKGNSLGWFVASFVMLTIYTIYQSYSILLWKFPSINNRHHGPIVLG